MRLRYVFIINSFGSNNNSYIINSIKSVCIDLGINYVIEINGPDLSTDDIVKKYYSTENIIFAVGGDGLINKVSSKIIGSKNMLGVIPYGTGNDFQKTINETLYEGFNQIDIVKINDHYFINTACFGIDADIANDDKFIHNKFIPKNQRYNASVIYHFLKYKSRNMEIEINNKTLKNTYTTVVLANGRYYGGKYKIGTNSSLTDGLIDVYLVNNLPKLKMARLILGMNKGLHEKSDATTKILTDSLKIKLDNSFKCNIDGEIIESNKFDINVIQNGISLYKETNLVNKILKK